MNKIHFNSIDSTNEYLKQNYKILEDLTFVSADYQTKGRGSNNREWESENSKNLLFSFLLLDKSLFQRHEEVSLVTALSIIQVLEKNGIEELKIKLPNDVYVKDKKICGTLLESTSLGEMQCLIVGVGLNVNQESFDGEYRATPTSIYRELGKKQEIERLKEELYDVILKNIELIKNNYDFNPIISKYLISAKI